MRRFVVLGLLFLLGNNLTFAATVGTIAGTVVDDNTGEPLPGVNIVVEGLGLGTSSDIEGDYFIENVPVGRYTLKATMIGYDALTYEDVRVIMDQTTRINFRMQEGFVQGKEVVITAERPMVEKDVTVKKMVRSAEEIQNLPVRDLTEMLTLQSGVIQIKSAEYGIPGFEDRGIEQIHVRGGRSGEIGYTIDGMYIENPIYGGIGKGTRLNKYAVEELEVQTGVFSAEYGDAMSSIVNNISHTGGAEYEVKLTLEGSGVSPQKNDQLRDYQKIAGRLSGPIIPALGDKFTFSISGDITTGAYRTLKFDDKVYNPNDVGGVNNQTNKVNWLDRYAGWRSFGFDNTSDIFTKLHWKIDNYKQLNFTYWYVNSEFQVFDRFYQFYEEGKNINRKWSERYNMEFRHQLNEKTYYTLSVGRFTQQMKIGVKNGDMDGDGYPDWVEFKAGTEARGLHMGHDYKGECDIPFIDKYLPGATITNDKETSDVYESWGPGCLPTKILYFSRTGEGAPYGDGVEMTIPVGGALEIQPYDKVKILDNSLQSFNPFRNGYLIVPLDSMEYTDDRGNSHFWHYGDPNNEWLEQGQYASWQYHYFPDSTYNLYSNPPTGVMTSQDIQAMRDSLYYIFYYEYFSGGADRYRHWTKSVTDEVKFDITSRVNKNHQLRAGVDFKRHFITFDEAQLPWLSEPYLEVYGLPGQVDRTGWDKFLNGTGEKSPLELGAYVQDKIEYPWMTINVGLRADMQNSRDTSWADPRASWSGLVPSDWKVLWSPRLGISHVITDRATFTFGYGRFFQNPTYRNIYLNDAGDLTTPSPIVGNAHVQAQKASSYEFGLNYQFSDYWRMGLVGWSKDYSDLAATERVKSFPYNYSVVVNYDYGSARGMDLTLEKRGGSAWSTVIQYTLSRATANRADAWQGYRSSDTPETMPKKEVLMNYDRTHNLTATAGYQFTKDNSPVIFGMRPLNHSNVNLTMVAMSGAPYTPYDINLKSFGATNSQRMPWYIETNMAYRKYMQLFGVRWAAGIIVRNIFNRENVIDIYAETGSAVDPGRLNTRAIEDGSASNTLFDRPYYYSDPRQIDFTLEASF
ncbi:MAG: carboxypeptidase-like regulatory domain-containing protein [Lentisphaeria bacterium]|nr:carboxypeptidase-like regulatory domain-containing protein [Candidatus Neomarinimicrobiota bacterium]MCF7843238.1 carboxypeptidase-like regulatory domain-containing protein [Lentisphaeria bacterium]